MPDRHGDHHAPVTPGLWLVAPGPDDDTGGLLERAAATVAAAERAGLGSIWVSESTADPGADGVPYEAYSLLGALAARSGRAHLGVVADGAERRAPSILAKIVTGIDVISHGRAVLSLDADCTTDGDAERVSEALTVCRMVLEDEHPTFAGRIYAIDDAVNRPAPVQEGGVPVVVFLHGDGPHRDELARLAGRSADALVVDGGGDGVRRALDALQGTDGAGGTAAAPGRGIPVIGLVGADTADVGGAVAGLRAAGASGWVIGIPYPWLPKVVEELAVLR